MGGLLRSVNFLLICTVQAHWGSQFQFTLFLVPCHKRKELGYFPLAVICVTPMCLSLPTIVHGSSELYFLSHIFSHFYTKRSSCCDVSVSEFIFEKSFCLSFNRCTVRRLAKAVTIPRKNTNAIMTVISIIHKFIFLVSS